MDFGLDIPNVHHGLGLDGYVGGASFDASLAINPESFRNLARRAEEVGFHTIWIADHLAFPESSAVSHPLNLSQNTGRDDDNTSDRTNVRVQDPVFEVLTMAMFLGALTRRCRIGLGVLVIPYRNPVVTAKMLATMDVLTGGRITVVAGVGWLKEAFDAVQADYGARGAVTNEYLEVMKAVWTQAVPSYEGQHYRLEPELRFRPSPVQQPHPPIWVGGISDVALRRAVAHGSGWLNVYQTPQATEVLNTRLRGMLVAAGRDPEAFDFGLRIRFQVADEPSAQEACIGRPERIAEGIRAYAEAGVTHLQLAPPPGPSTATMLEQVDRFEADVLPLVSDLWETQAHLVGAD